MSDPSSEVWVDYPDHVCYQDAYGWQPATIVSIPALPLPPDKWDRFDVRWSPSWENGRLMWNSHGGLAEMSLTHLELAGRGPFTEESDDE